MSKKDIADMKAYFYDHHAHFDGWPMDFESEGGTVYSFDECIKHIPEA